MFRKLRNKFLAFGMTLTSLVLVAAFAAIYMATYENIRQNDAEKLSELAINPVFPGISGISVFHEKFKESISQFLIPSDYTPSFTLLLNEDGEIIDKYSLIDISEENYAKAAEKAWRNRDGNAVINVDGRMWRYAVSSKERYVIRSFQNSSNTGESISIEITMDGYQVDFLDVTESHRTLQELLLTFLIVGAGTLIAVFFISLFFANRAVKPIKSAWEAQKQFIADASHELKTPLTIINSNYGVLISKKKETIESQLKWLEYIKDGAERMNKLTGDLLCLAKTEGAVPDAANDTPVNISGIAQCEIDSMEIAAREKGVTVSCNIEPDIFINCEAEKPGQIFRILLDNAIKYSNDGGSVDVKLKGEKHTAVFEIKNTGCGIAREHLPRIFDRFYRTDISRRHNGGYGLGLSIAKAVVESMGGRIYAASEENKNAVFTVVFMKR